MVLSMDRWVGKVAVVTGAASGIGAAIVSRLVEEGLIVAGLDLNPEPIKEHAKQLSTKKGQLHAFKVDIGKAEEVKKVFKQITDQLGPVHILCNNAGVGTFKKFFDSDIEDWQKVFNTNVIGLCNATKEAVKIMRDNNIKGHIVNTNSTLGHKVEDFSLNVYPASKFAVTALTETLRQELNGLGTRIKVTSVSPSAVTTGLTTLNPNLPPEMRKMVEELPRLQPEDIADGILYALSTPEHVQIHELTIQHVDWK